MPSRQDHFCFRAALYFCFFPLILLGSGAVFPAQAAVSALPDAPVAQNQSQNQSQNRPPRHSRNYYRWRAGGQTPMIWKAPAVYGVRPVFTATNNWKAPPLTFHQKAQLYAGQVTSPWMFFTSFLDAGFGQLDNSPAYGGGAEAYFKRAGSSYADQVDGDFWHNLILPQLLHEDPRYFRKGSGTFVHRFLWAASAPVWARRDNMTWGINYSHIVGNVIGSAIGNVYYPQSDRTVGQTFGRAFTGLAESTAASELAEFWPAIAHRIDRRRYRKMQRQEAEENRLVQAQQQ